MFDKPNPFSIRKAARRIVEGAPYEDSETGALDLLRQMSNLSPKEFVGAECIPDSHVQGCWLATTSSGRRFIIYTEPHRDAPDFEEVD